MKSITLFSAFLTILVFATSCDNGKEQTLSPVSITLTGDFLFEGPNTLQAENSINLEDLKKEASVEKVNGVRIHKVFIDCQQIDPNLVESATLQITSKNNEMLTLGTVTGLSQSKVPVTIAEETEIMDYLKDEETYWILDVNIAQDQDELSIPIEIELSVKS